MGKDSKVVRIYPESKTGLINWIENNFHEIDQFIATFVLSDGTTMTVYDCFSYLEATGMASIQVENIHQEAEAGTFNPKKRQ